MEGATFLVRKSMSGYGKVYYHNKIDISFGPGGFASATRGGVAMRSWPLLLPYFGLSLFLSFFSWPGLGILQDFNITSIKKL